MLRIIVSCAAPIVQAEKFELLSLNKHNSENLLFKYISQKVANRRGVLSRKKLAQK